MPTEYSTLELNYSYKKVEYQEYEIKYSYDLISYQVAEYDTVYSFSASTHATLNPMVGHWSDHTQLIGNKLPFWHAGRYNQTSNYQQFINSMAMNSEYLYDQFTNTRKDIFIETAPLDDIYSGYIGNYPKELYDDSDRQTENLIYNSDFSISSRALDDRPCRWRVDKTASATVSLDNSYGLSSGPALEIKTLTGEYATIYQDSQTKYPEGQDIVFSAMVNVPNNSSSMDTNASGTAVLGLEVLYIDGTCDHATVNVPLSTTEEGVLEDNSTGQISYWQKIHTNIKLTKPSALVKYYIGSNNIDNTSDFLFYADCLQLENGNRPTRWKRSVVDAPYWVYSEPGYVNEIYSIYANNTSDYTQTGIVLNNNTSYFDVRPKTRLHYCSNEDTFFYNAIPTALKSFSSYAGSETTVTDVLKGIVTDIFDTNIQSVKYEPSDSKIKKSSFEFNDDYGKFKIAERDYFGDNETEYTVITDHLSSGSVTYSLDVKALTFQEDHVVAFCKETLDSNTYYTFKYIKPVNSFTGDYFECVQDFKISDASKDVLTGIETGSVEFNTIGKVEGEKNRYIIETNDGNHKYEAVFAFDYYMDLGDGQFLTREKYDQICIT